MQSTLKGIQSAIQGVNETSPVQYFYEIVVGILCLGTVALITETSPVIRFGLWRRQFGSRLAGWQPGLQQVF